MKRWEMAKTVNTNLDLMPSTLPQHSFSQFRETAAKFGKGMPVFGRKICEKSTRKEGRKEGGKC